MERKISQNNNNDSDLSKPESSRSLSIMSRIVLFLLLPFLVGCFGIGMSYLHYKYPVEGMEPRPVDFDTDFLYPFIMTIIVVVIIFIQTGGFKGLKTKSLITWPKVVEKRKIIHKTVVVDDDGNELSDADIAKIRNSRKMNNNKD